jgi:hypothetical protein
LNYSEAIPDTQDTIKNRLEPNMKPEKILQYSDEDNICDIYFHFPFYIGVQIGEDRFERMYEITKTIFETNALHSVVVIDLCHSIEIATPKSMRDYSKRQFFVNEKTICIRYIDLTSNDGISNNVTSENAEYSSILQEAYLSIFKTGIGIGHLKFRITFKGKVNSTLIYQAFREIYCQLEPLELEEDNKNESKISQIMLNGIKLIRSSASVFCNGRKIEETLGPVFYIYPLFHVKSIRYENFNDFLSLLYLRSDNQKVAKPELERALYSNASIYGNEYFVAMWDASLAGGYLLDEEICGSYERILEISSYVWNSMYTVDNYISERLDKMLIVKDNTDAKEGRSSQGRFASLKSVPTPYDKMQDAKNQLLEIQNLRIMAKNIQSSYTSVKVSLWAGAIQVFDKILIDAWGLNQLEKSIRDKIEMLTFAYQNTIHEIESAEISYTNKALVTFQRIAIPLAALIGLLPVIADRGNYSSQFSWSNLFTTYLPTLIAMSIILSIILITYFVDRFFVNRKLRKPE